DRNTLIIFIGDHGYLLGHHGRFEKHCLFLEAIRAPLIIRTPPPPMPPMPPPPPQKRRSSGALVEFIDLAPTILTFCGEEVPKNDPAPRSAAAVAGQDGQTPRLCLRRVLRE